MINTKYKNSTIYEWACDFDINSIDNENKPAEISKQEFQNIINTIKNNKEIYGNMIIRNVDNGKYSLSDDNPKVTNATIEYKGDIILIYKGTASDKDWRDNGVGGYSFVTETVEQVNALRYFDAMYSKYGTGNVYVTGHSKGGNKAQYVTVLRGGQIKETWSFDGQGFGFPFINRYQKEIEKYNGKIHNICNEYDFVNIVLQSIVKDTKFIKNNSTLGLDGFTVKDIIQLISDPKGFAINTAKSTLMHKFGGWHSPYTMFTRDNNNNLKLDCSVEQSSLMRELEEFLDYCHTYMEEDDWRYVCYMLMSLMMDDKEDTYGGVYKDIPEGFEVRFVSLLRIYMQKHKELDIPFILSESSPDGYSGFVRDFTDSTKQDILNIVTAVESEPWWNPFKWDCWYHLQDALGILDLPADGEELYDYYRKVIDKDNIAKSEIERIFSEVYQLEEKYTKKIVTLQDMFKKVLGELDTLHTEFRLDTRN